MVRRAVNWLRLECWSVPIIILAAILLRGDWIHSQEEPLTKPDFKGMWNGAYENDKRETGTGKYLFHEERDGRFKVTVTWIYEGKEHMMELKGHRLGLDALSLEGRDKNVTYRYLGRLNKDGMLILPYLSVNEENGTTGTGVSTLTRPR